MQPGDLVFHKEDIKCTAGPIPGLIVKLVERECAPASHQEAIVYFTDRAFGEYHKIEDLIKVEDYEGEEYDYR